jgi:chromosome segregation ATPase
VWSIVGAISPENSPTEVVGLEAQGRAIEDQLAENHSALTKTESSLSELESRRSNLEQAHTTLRIVLDRIAGVDKSIKQKTIEIDKMTNEIIQAKNVAEPIWKRIARLESSATMVTRHATLQKEYADTIMDICALGCMDARRARIIDRILREVSSYPAVIKTKSLRTKLEEVETTCGRMLSQGLVK